MKDKEERKKESKSLLKRIMTFGARSKAAKAPTESKKYLDKEKIKKFKLKR
jgi:hypothetical protein